MSTTSLGGDLFAINTNDGIIYRVGPDGIYSEFLVDQPVGRAETSSLGNCTALGQTANQTSLLLALPASISSG